MWATAALTPFHPVMENSTLIHNLNILSVAPDRESESDSFYTTEGKKKKRKRNKRLKCIQPSPKSLSWVNQQERSEEEGCQLIQKHNQTTKEKNERSHSPVQSLKFGL